MISLARFDRPKQRSQFALRIEDWRYQPESSRDLRLDFLRGFALFAMIVDHIGAPSWLYFVTGGDRFYISGAEVFLFISGLLVGIVHGDTARTNLSIAIKRVLKRACELYLLAVALALIFLALDPARWQTVKGTNDVIQLIVGVVTLQRSYTIVDILPLYALLMLVAPVGLVLLTRGHTRILLAATVLVWIFYQLFPVQMSNVPWQMDSWFKVAAWQVIFFVPVTVGFHRAAIIKSANRFVNYRDLGVSALVLLGVISIYFADFTIPSTFIDIDLPNFIDVFMSKANVGPGRLLALLAVLPVAALTTTLLWKPLNVLIGWLFIPLGQNALYGYTAQVFFWRAFDPIVRDFLGYAGHEPNLNAVLQLTVVLAIWLMIRRRFMFRADSFKSGSRRRPERLG